MIEFTEQKKFTKEQAQELFLSVGWVSGQYSGGLYKALIGSSNVITAWDGGRLVWLSRVLDDGDRTAHIHYVLVNP